MSTLLLVIALLLDTTQDIQAAVVTINPGDTIQAVVDANPPGTTYQFSAGIFRMQAIKPKEGDTFQGTLSADGSRLTILSGARLLTQFTREGSYWVAAGQTQRGQVRPPLNATPECLPDYPRCGFPEDLFINDAALHHVGTLAAVSPGKYYFDYDQAKIYFADDPAGKKVETSITRSAFYGSANSVTIQNLIVEKYATPGLMGAIGEQLPGLGWTIQNNEARFNHSRGLVALSNSRVIGNYLHNNGQSGMGCEGSNILIEGNEIAYNGYTSGMNWFWDGGAFKCAKTLRLIVRKNYSHDNLGPGMWTDIDSIDTLYEDNRVINNIGPGIYHEISYRAIIRNNIVQHNANATAPLWLENGQIQMGTSQNVEVYGNTIEVDSHNFNQGMVAFQQDRGTGRYGRYQATGNYFHHNIITITGNGPFGRSGVIQDNASPNVYTSNHFDYNVYSVPDVQHRYWDWDWDDRTWTEWQARGQDLHGCAGPRPACSPADAQPPLVSLTSPREGDTLSGIVSIVAEASDNVGVAKVELYFNNAGTPFFTATRPPYALTGDSTKAPNGSYSMTVTAHDLAGNTASTAVNFTVRNP